MRHLPHLFLAILLCLGCSAHAQAPSRGPTSPQVQAAQRAAKEAGLSIWPSEGMAVGYVSSDVAGKWLVVKEGFLPVARYKVVEGGAAVVFEDQPGTTCGIIFFPPQDGQPVITPVVLGGTKPPEPEPPEPPDDKYGFYAALWPIFNGNRPAAQEYSGRAAGLADVVRDDPTMTTVQAFQVKQQAAFKGFAEKYQLDPARINTAVGTIFQKEIGGGPALDQEKAIDVLRAMSAAAGRIQ